VAAAKVTSVKFSVSGVNCPRDEAVVQSSDAPSLLPVRAGNPLDEDDEVEVEETFLIGAEVGGKCVENTVGKAGVAKLGTLKTDESRAAELASSSLMKPPIARFSAAAGRVVVGFDAIVSEGSARADDGGRTAVPGREEKPFSSSTVGSTGKNFVGGNVVFLSFSLNLLPDKSPEAIWLPCSPV